MTRRQIELHLRNGQAEELLAERRLQASLAVAVSLGIRLGFGAKGASQELENLQRGGDV